MPNHPRTYVSSPSDLPPKTGPGDAFHSGQFIRHWESDDLKKEGFTPERIITMPREVGYRSLKGVQQSKRREG
jgi:hypothetical protein